MHNWQQASDVTEFDKSILCLLLCEELLRQVLKLKERKKCYFSQSVSSYFSDHLWVFLSLYDTTCCLEIYSAFVRAERSALWSHRYVPHPWVLWHFNLPLTLKRGLQPNGLLLILSHLYSKLRYTRTPTLLPYLFTRELLVTKSTELHSVRHENPQLAMLRKSKRTQNEILWIIMFIFRDTRTSLVSMTKFKLVYRQIHPLEGFFYSYGGTVRAKQWKEGDSSSHFFL